jgi:hypothetical protein
MTDKTNLNKNELETLCQAYLDGNLSRREELELSLLLAKTSYDSELINEVKRLSAMELTLCNVPEVRRKGLNRRRIHRFEAVVAVVAMIIIMTTSIISNTNNDNPLNENFTECIVYINGKEVTSNRVAIAKQQKKYADEIMNQCEKLEQQQLEKINQLLNL